MKFDWREFGETMCAFVEGAFVIACFILVASGLYSFADYLIGPGN